MGCSFWFAHGVVFECLAHEVLGFGLASCGDGGVVVVDVFGVDDDLDGGGVVEFFEFEGAEFDLCWSASAEDVDGGGLVVFEGVVDVVGDFGGVEFVGGFGKDAGDVEAYVSDADDGDVGGGEVPGALEVGVAVVEADEFCCAVGAFEFCAWDGEVAVCGGPGGEDDGVVVVAEVVDSEVGADGDVADKADVGVAKDFVEGGDNAFDTWVVRCYAVADESEGGGHAFVEVDGGGGVVFGEEVGGVDACGAGADDGDAQRFSHKCHIPSDRGQV
ncbi:hypothetical protein FRC0028_02086 [Corynebacterium diphtheriae]|nr:hypothetical protein FRC0081_01495 [Corynebacterium diphtheriae]CAB0712596.1 hypothetical protein FRC0028_02086 [Corynebacterium diphtheriae]CAB0761413.1 hypothetical protein FRC0134_02084 [Corynebacterium diphtheriae]CAB0777776.1 hypothetical protein FRC0174_02082 [Corynebacterium diphtheriae]CAB0907856.1 hypothetical protein FRC0423_01479 [Corynebacterium diphtheriae]